VGGHEQKIQILKFRVETLTDEVAKVNEERSDLQSKYDALFSDRRDLQQTVETTLAFSRKSAGGDTERSEFELDRAQRFQSRIDELTSKRSEQQLEITNLRNLNARCMEETLSLRTKLELKEKEIAAMSEERNEWETRYEVTEQNLKDSEQRMKELDSQNERYKFQIETGTVEGGGPSNLRKISTTDTFVERKGPHHHQTTTTIVRSPPPLSPPIVMDRQLSWKSDVTANSSAMASITKYGDYAVAALNEPLNAPLARIESSYPIEFASKAKTPSFADDGSLEAPSEYSSSASREGMDIRSVRLSLWCVVFWIFSVAELTYFTHFAHSNGVDHLLFVMADLCLFLGVLTTLNHIYLEVAGSAAIAGTLFIVGGIMHLVATAVYVDNRCDRRQCVVIHFGCDFMAESLSLFLGIDVMDFGFGQRVHRVMTYCVILAVCTIMIGTVWEGGDSVASDGPRGSTLGIGVVGLWATGVVAALLFISLAVMTALGVNEQNITRTVWTHSLNALVGFALLHCAGLLFYALPGYQVLLMLTVCAMIAYEMLFM